MSGEPRPSYVYAIRAGDYVKIGKADDPRSRTNGFRTGCPYGIEVIAFMRCHSPEAAFTIERDWHDTLARVSQHYRGEWYHWSEVLEVALLVAGDAFESNGRPFAMNAEHALNRYSQLATWYIEAHVNGQLSGAEQDVWMNDGGMPSGCCFDLLSFHIPLEYYRLRLMPGVALDDDFRDYPEPTPCRIGPVVRVDDGARLNHVGMYRADDAGVELHGEWDMQFVRTTWAMQDRIDALVATWPTRAEEASGVPVATLEEALGLAGGDA